MSIDLNAIARNSSFLFTGFLYTFKVTIVSSVLGILLGIPLAIMRLSKNSPARYFSMLYVNFFRSIPLVQILLSFYIVIPLIYRIMTSHILVFNANLSAYITFTIFETAYFTEIIKSGLLSVPQSQKNAAAALGMHPLRIFRHIIFPQAFLLITPILMTQIIIIFQDVSLVYSIGATDLFGAADQINQRDLKPVEMYTLVAIIYFIICYCSSVLTNTIRNKIRTKLHLQ